MNPKKISFIICVNDEIYYKECLFYIERLHVPAGFSIDVFPVRQAASIFQAYNQAMQQSDAKYKVYMHQDVFLIYQDILIEFLRLFEGHPEVGMAGVLGAREFPENKRFYRAWDVGNVLGCSDKRAFHNELEKEASEVVAIDGMFMMTQYDLPWREDVLSGWDFYDISQSLEFGEKGYQVWVPHQERPWCIHDCGILSLAAYDERQKEFLKEYGKCLPDYTGQGEVYPEEYRKRLQLMRELKEQCKLLLFTDSEKIREVLAQVWDERFLDTELIVLKNILKILSEEERQGIKEGFLYDCGSFLQAVRKYLKVKFYLWRKQYAEDDGKECPEISNEAMNMIREHVMWQE